MTGPHAVAVVDVRFEHHRPGEALGIDEPEPRLSWRFANAPPAFQQAEYEIRLNRTSRSDGVTTDLGSVRVESPESQLVPWPLKRRPDGSAVVGSRETVSAQVRARPQGSGGAWTDWSEPAWFETGLLSRADWGGASRVSAPWAAEDPDAPKPEDLFRKTFELGGGGSNSNSNSSSSSSSQAEATIRSARLYVTAQGVYEAEINGRRVGDQVLAPGWTTYNSALAYQTYDVTGHMRAGANCIGVRVAEGWFTGRLGFDDGGWRNVFGNRTALLVRLEVDLAGGPAVTVATDGSWRVARGPIRLAEIYDGEKYDATAEIAGWSSPGEAGGGEWAPVDVLPPLPGSVHLRRGSGEPVRRVELVKPAGIITTPSGKTVLDFGQNLVGFVRLGGMRGPRGHSVVLSHAEVLEKGELGTRPLRGARNQDRYTLRGDGAAEEYEPRFTFHGFRYAQVDGWPAGSGDLAASAVAVVCHTDMEERGSFACSDERLGRLFDNVRWSMRGNFLSIPTDCPQRNERLGWTGDLAVFAPTANFLYGSFGMLRDWLAGVRWDQQHLGGIPPLISPNIWWDRTPTSWGAAFPCAVWHDVVVLAPWAMWEATGDIRILEESYDSMKTWLDVIPRDKALTHLWDLKSKQLGDWLDPDAPPDDPAKAKTDAVLVANAFLISSLDHTARTAALLGRDAEAEAYRAEARAARAQFAAQYVAPDGRMTSHAQTAYALAACLDLLPQNGSGPAPGPGDRLAGLVRDNRFRVGTGFAGTPYVCEALVRPGQAGRRHDDVALSMLLSDANPGWLYPVSMGATTVWERWDSMLPDGSINPGDMTSFNHYAYGAVAVFMVERLAGLRRLDPGWRRARAEPVLLFDGPGAVRWAKAEHLTPYGRVECSWRLEEAVGAAAAAPMTLFVDVVVPPTTEMEVVLPGDGGEAAVELVKSGEWSFKVPFKPRHD